MLHALKSNWRNYLIEAWALGMFLFSAAFFAALLELPGAPLRQAVANPFLRRALMGCAMGGTAVALIYSGWGRRSGAHLNPAVTLAFWYLKKIGGRDAIFYALAQTLGGTAAMLACGALFRPWVGAPEVHYVLTLPGMAGTGAAFLGEALISFGLVLAVLYCSNNARTAPYTGVLAGILVMLFITFEAPLSGMSMNPARSFASAVAAGHFAGLWIYCLAPPLGMFGAAAVWKKWICRRTDFRCSLQGG